MPRPARAASSVASGSGGGASTTPAWAHQLELRRSCSHWRRWHFRRCLAGHGTLAAVSGHRTQDTVVSSGRHEEVRPGTCRRRRQDLGLGGAGATGTQQVRQPGEGGARRRHQRGRRASRHRCAARGVRVRQLLRRYLCSARIWGLGSSVCRQSGLPALPRCAGLIMLLPCCTTNGTLITQCLNYACKSSPGSWRPARRRAAGTAAAPPLRPPARQHVSQWVSGAASQAQHG
jgi:hypothetical protein